ncbi:MAG: hypothetical protein UU73_C0001G0033 [Candidatus Daviesbacteria bacterium GW2011_GWA1_41_61]|uniref:DUF192 domain-containing protein n=1 Tax=Candidatus Daviesbacteria bacterium GW2011_GWA2_40_9 TaxID=1618424 RepID=A0A0G0U1D3_9BACT|nr:MAG: hypothetical protein UU26_C0002G0070 [Candidatus Daviesbacteria bacterium GW2011_GWC1_40_9]KKR82924.1 MAG: hypothetical protein UU29_C0008G0033 [Candidatus Daviesbacteria bacterium GW2011_GWA2_40_9]KKR92852.1 MAG: hypothetical protein UU44_C0004G0034 [Candidatus Daviesbacteria bacterium GW2011_GWB1_41_15]KKS15396.1 MAG: hypothetical protein UU73_C0001G0033 [Candidatus Daviesbacteria bacterium GW2011_GWA1_41_61]
MDKKFAIQIIALVLVILGALYLSSNSSILQSVLPLNQNLSRTQIKINETVVNVEVADTPSERSKGLGGRLSLASNSGMLFVFPETKKTQFWMKGMNFPLDFIFIRDGKVVDIIPNVQPPLPNQPDSNLPVYEPTVSINMMLEVSAGFVAAHSIKLGDQVYLIK